MGSVVHGTGSATVRGTVEKPAVSDTSHHKSSRRRGRDPALRDDQQLPRAGASASEDRDKTHTIISGTPAWLYVLSGPDGARETTRVFVDGETVEIGHHHQQRLEEILREICQAAHRQPAVSSETTAGCGSLTPRQLQIAVMIRDGFSNKIIARDLGLTAGTVKAHLHRIYRALKIANRVELAIRTARSQITNG